MIAYATRVPTLRTREGWRKGTIGLLRMLIFLLVSWLASIAVPAEARSAAPVRWISGSSVVTGFERQLPSSRRITLKRMALSLPIRALRSAVASL